MYVDGTKSWFTDEQRVGVSLFWDACASRYRSTNAELRASPAGRRLSQVTGHAPPSDSEAQERDEQLFQAMQTGVRTGDFGALEQTFAALGNSWSRSGVALSSWYELTDLFRCRMSALLFEHYGRDLARLQHAMIGLQRYTDRASATITQEYVAERERQLQAQKRSTEEALTLYKRLAESGIIGIFVCDIFGQAKDANEAFLSMLGYTRAELLNLNWVEVTPPEWSGTDIDAIEQLKTHGRTRPWEKEYFRKDGTRVPVLLGVALLNETDCVAFVLDITERKRLDELRLRSQELHVQNQRVREANRLKSEFLANMSHELRTPLNSIIGFADLLFDGEVAPDSPHYKEFLGDILKSGRHLLQLINDVLDLAKVESGKMDFRPEPCQLVALVGEVCAVLRTLVADKRITLEVSLDPSINEVTLDPARLKQVLYNYVSNALKFTPPEGTVTIRTRAEDASSFRIEVIDNGIGIAESDLGRLFLEFQQLDAGSAKKHAGTGLGLALTKRIVEAQGGLVGVRSKLDEGSVFSAVLPRQMAVAARGSEPTRLTTDSGVVVLVVDDDARDRNVIVRLLDGAGYGVETAATGAEAIKLCSDQPFDAITLDLLLPDLNGLDVLHRLRSEGMNRDTPVVVVSVVAERGVVGGFPVHDYLRKPVRGADLLASLSHAGVLPQTSGVVLVVDDDLSSLKLMQVSLGNLGYEVVCSEDGEAALAACERQRPLAIILDLLMPKVDGFQFLARFRSVPENRDVPVIVWTVKDLTVVDRRRLNELAHGVFTKGDGRPADLLDELQSLLAATRRSLVGE